MEVLKWRVGVERVLGGVRNLEREKVRWERKVGETGMSSLLIRDFCITYGCLSYPTQLRKVLEALFPAIPALIVHTRSHCLLDCHPRIRIHSLINLVARTEQLKSTLEEEKELLKKRLWERDQMIKCDELAKRILARGKSRIELDEYVYHFRIVSGGSTTVCSIG